MDNPLLSVIIPVYNAQEVLATAVESVLSQGVDAIEVILVNDGSRDGSLEICQEYAQKDPRFKVIDQVNAGPGAARFDDCVQSGQGLIFFSTDHFFADAVLVTYCIGHQVVDINNNSLAHFA